jgi:hypothetical protein
MATFRNPATKGVRVIDRRGSPRAHKRAASLAHDHGKCHCHYLPAHGGHHLNPSEGFWRVRQEAIGAGRCLHDLQQLSRRTRHVLMAHQERPIYAFHW